jgi:hypothetical protein
MSATIHHTKNLYSDSDSDSRNGLLSLEQKQVLFMFLAFRKTKFINKIFKAVIGSNMSDYYFTLGDGTQWDADMDGDVQVMTQDEQYLDSDIDCDPRSHEFPTIFISKSGIDFDLNDLCDMTFHHNKDVGNNFMLVESEQETDILLSLVEEYNNYSYAPGGLDYYKVMFNTKLQINNFTSLIKCTKYNKQLLTLIADNLNIKFKYKRTTKALLCHKIIRKINTNS